MSTSMSVGAQCTPQATYGLAYSARCEHEPGAPFRPGGFREALARHGEEYLRL